MKLIADRLARKSLHAALAGALTLVTLTGLTSCATRADVAKVEDRIIRLERQGAQTRHSLNQLDSLARSTSSSKTGDFAQLAAQFSDLSERLEQLTASINEVQERLAFMQSRGGGQGGPPTGSNDQSGGAPQTSGVDCNRIYDDSFIQFRNGEYEAAEMGFKDFLQFCGKSDLADNAQYWIGEIYYARKKYDSAAGEFNQLVSNYPNSEKAPTAYYKIGRCFEETGKESQAREYYQKVVDQYPSTPEAGLASDKIAELTGSAANRGG